MRSEGTSRNSSGNLSHEAQAVTLKTVGLAYGPEWPRLLRIGASSYTGRPIQLSSPSSELIIVIIMYKELYNVDYFTRLLRIDGEPFRGLSTFEGRSVSRKADLKLDAARHALLERLPGIGKAKIALFTFTEQPSFILDGEANERDRIRDALDQLVPNDGTDIAAALLRRLGICRRCPTRVCFASWWSATAYRTWRRLKRRPRASRVGGQSSTSF